MSSEDPSTYHEYIGLPVEVSWFSDENGWEDYPSNIMDSSHRLPNVENAPPGWARPTGGIPTTHAATHRSPIPQTVPTATHLVWPDQRGDPSLANGGNSKRSGHLPPAIQASGLSSQQASFRHSEATVAQIAAVYRRSPYPSREEIAQLAGQTGLTDSQVATW